MGCFPQGYRQNNVFESLMSNWKPHCVHGFHICHLRRDCEPLEHRTSVALLTRQHDPAHGHCPQGPVEGLVDSSGNGRGDRGAVHCIRQRDHREHGGQGANPPQQSLRLWDRRGAVVYLLPFVWYHCHFRCLFVNMHQYPNLTKMEGPV